MLNEEKEIKDFETEKLVLNKKLEIYQNNLVEELNAGGLGNDIIHRLKNPIRLTKFQVFKMKWNVIIDKLLNVL